MEGKMQVGNNPKEQGSQSHSRAQPHTMSHSACTGTAGQKGRVMGILRSLGALARALGPILAAAGECGFVLLPLFGTRQPRWGKRGTGTPYMGSEPLSILG